jgi:hypothetical protein
MSRSADSALTVTALHVVELLLRRMRLHLRYQLEGFVCAIFEPAIGSSQSTSRFALDALCRLCTDPQILADMFVRALFRPLV